MRMVRLSLAVILLSVLAARASAQDPGYKGWGPRVGITLDPDQIHLGAHVDFGHFAEHVRFQPSIEAGFGDDVILGAFQFDAVYRFRTAWEAWSPYLGGGPVLAIVDFDHDDVHGRGLDDDHTETEAGLNIVGGIERGLSGGDRFFLEARIGLIDAPDLKFTAGWTFF